MTEKERRKKGSDNLFSEELLDMLEKEANLKHRYYCPMCGEQMEKEEGHEDYLNCPRCGHYMNIDEYYDQFVEDATSASIFYFDEDD